MTEDERANTAGTSAQPDPQDASTASTAGADPAASASADQSGTAAEPAGATSAGGEAVHAQAEVGPDATAQAPEASDASGAQASAGGGAASSARVDALASEVAALKERVAQLVRDLEGERDHATDYMQKWQRAQADMANFRRRVQQEEEQFAAMAAAQAMALVLPALDSFERAFKTLPESLQRLTWIEGIFLVESQLRRTLEAHGVSPFEPKPGDALDATRHQPVAQAETAAHPEGTVVEVVQRGYELNGRVLRPALVRIARASASPAPGSSGSSGSGGGGSGAATSGNGPPPAEPPPGAAGDGGP